MCSVSWLLSLWYKFFSFFSQCIINCLKWKFFVKPEVMTIYSNRFYLFCRLSLVCRFPYLQNFLPFFVLCRFFHCVFFMFVSFFKCCHPLEWTRLANKTVEGWKSVKWKKQLTRKHVIITTIKKTLTIKCSCKWRWLRFILYIFFGLPYNASKGKTTLSFS